MITAVDTNVLLDLFDDGPSTFRSEAQSALAQSAAQGSLLLSTVCYAELAPTFVSQRVLDKFLSGLSIRATESNLDEAFIAGKLFAHHGRTAGRGGRIIADFLVGAHAMHAADRLLTRDRRFYQMNFERLRIVSPQELA